MSGKKSQIVKSAGIPATIIPIAVIIEWIVDRFGPGIDGETSMKIATGLYAAVAGLIRFLKVRKNGH